jgi:hypothetical protein
MKIFVLPHETYCEALGRCACERTKGLKPRRIPTSITLPAESTTTGFEDAVLLVSDIVKAVRAGELIVRRELPMTSVEPATTAAKAASTKKRKSAGGAI